MQMMREMKIGLSHQLGKPRLLQSFVESIVLDVQAGILIEGSEHSCNFGSIAQTKASENRPEQDMPRIFPLALDESRLLTKLIQESG